MQYPDKRPRRCGTPNGTGSDSRNHSGPQPLPSCTLPVVQYRRGMTEPTAQDIANAAYRKAISDRQN
jgi:hypothetical protein